MTAIVTEVQELGSDDEFYDMLEDLINIAEENGLLEELEN